MKLVFRLILPFLALLLLAAHFYRAGWLPLAALSVALLPLLAVPRPWAARTLQAALVLGALEWLRTLLVLAGARLEAGESWLRLVIILGGVLLLTLAAAWPLRTAAVRHWYGSGKS